VRHHILALKAEYPPLTTSEIATICDLKFGQAGDYRTVQRVLDSEPLPKLTGRRFPLHRDEEESDQRRHNIIQLHIEGWTIKHIAGYLGITHHTVHRTLHRWAKEEVWGIVLRPCYHRCHLVAHFVGNGRFVMLCVRSASGSVPTFMAES
jgi:transposase